MELHYASMKMKCVTAIAIAFSVSVAPSMVAVQVPMST